LFERDKDINDMDYFIDLEKASRRKERKMDVRTIAKYVDQAGDATQKLNLKYLRQKDGQVVYRRVAPYSYRGDKLFAACELHDNGIHSFLVRNILNATGSITRFRPKWPVEVGAGSKKPPLLVKR
jgi:hypothetical protein